MLLMIDNYTGYLLVSDLIRATLINQQVIVH